MLLCFALCILKIFLCSRAFGFSHLFTFRITHAEFISIICCAAAETHSRSRRLSCIGASTDRALEQLPVCLLVKLFYLVYAFQTFLQATLFFTYALVLFFEHWKLLESFSFGRKVSVMILKRLQLVEFSDPLWAVNNFNFNFLMSWFSLIFSSLRFFDLLLLIFYFTHLKALSSHTDLLGYRHKIVRVGGTVPAFIMLPVEEIVRRVAISGFIYNAELASQGRLEILWSCKRPIRGLLLFKDRIRMCIHSRCDGLF